MKSVWESTAKVQKFQALSGDVNVDVLIIGGGLAGVLCAREMKASGIDYILVEGETVCNGVTKNTTAKVTSQHGLIYDKLIRQFGVEKAKMYFEANQEALEKFRKLCGDGGIDCHFENKDSYVYSKTDYAKLEKELKALDRIGCGSGFVTYKNDLPIPVSTVGAVCFKEQAQFNPLQFVSAIVPDLNIYEHTFVTAIDFDDNIPGTGESCLCALYSGGKIRAKKVIVTTHFPFINRHGLYFMKLYQERSYVVAIEGGDLQVDGMYVDEAQKGLSFRNYGDLLLIGGGDHRTGKTGGNWKELRLVVKNNYPNTIEKYWWATQDCMSLDGVPYIGAYSKNTPNLFVATGFNKWGMSTSMVAASILSDLVQGNRNEYANVFDPGRTMLRPQLFLNALDTTADMLIPTTRRCPHMGCALKRNVYEHTWDCPCHGSRFTDRGELIDNPAMRDAKLV